MLSALEFVMSAVTADEAVHVEKQKVSPCPANVEKSLRRFSTSPVLTSTLSEVFRASIDVRPADTAPIACPATPSPVSPLESWFDVTRLLPSCRVRQSSKNGTALQESVMSEVTVVAAVQLISQKLKLCPTNAARSLPDPETSPV